MSYSAKLFAEGNAEKLYECIISEQTSYNRSSFSITKKENGLEFDITAKDAVALRATLNSISQMLIIFEGAKKND